MKLIKSLGIFPSTANSFLIFAILSCWSEIFFFTSPEDSSAPVFVEKADTAISCLLSSIYSSIYSWESFQSSVASCVSVFILSSPFLSMQYLPMSSEAKDALSRDGVSILECGVAIGGRSCASVLFVDVDAISPIFEVGSLVDVVVVGEADVVDD